MVKKVTGLVKWPLKLAMTSLELKNGSYPAAFTISTLNSFTIGGQTVKIRVIRWFFYMLKKHKIRL